jgi:multidrug efflux pump subunit AcrB
MILIAVVVLGLTASYLLPVSLIPAVDIPYITVQVIYPQQSARELEESVVRSLRGRLQQIEGVKDIQSRTKDGSAIITLFFNHGQKSDYLFIEVNERIDRAMGSLPKDMERPYVMKAGAADMPAFYINLSIKNDEHYVPPSDLYPVSDRFAELSDFAGNVIVKRLEQFSEVAMVDVSGYISREILIIPDQSLLTQTGIELSALENAVKNLNYTLGNLTIRDGEYQFSVKVQRNTESVKEIENAYLKVNNRIFQVKDLAKVIEHPQVRNTIVKSNGRDALVLAVIKQSDAKMSRLKSVIDDLMQQFDRDYPDVDFTVTRDQTELLEYSINNLFQNIILGVMLASLIIFLFMQNFRVAGLIVITIPIALIFSMLFFYLLGISINIVSLSGLLLGVGMMTDNSVIAIDNIIFHWNSGKTLKDATVDGIHEIFAPMLSSVLTTCAVFVPLIFISGIAGALFYDQAMAVVITLFCSLAATCTVIPVYYYFMFRKHTGMYQNRFLARFDFQKTTTVYERGLVFLFRHRWIVTSCFAVAIAGIVFLFFVIRKDRLPEITYTDMLAYIEWNQRITVDENSRRVAQLVKEIEGDAKQITEMTGVQQFMLLHTRETGNTESVLYIATNGNKTVNEMEAFISDHISGLYPNAIVSFETSGNIFELIFAEREAKLVARIRPTAQWLDDPKKINALLSKLSEELYPIGIQPVASENFIVFVARPRIMTLYGITFGDLTGALQNALNANTLFTIMQGKFSVPVVVGDNKMALREILDETVIKKQGMNFPLSLFFQESRGEDFKTIISGSEGNYYPLPLMADDRDIPEIMETIRETVRQDENFEVSFSGSYFSNRVMVRELIIILIVALLLLYFILASQFESLIQPVIILSEIVLDIFGTLLALFICDISLNIMSLIGIVITCGIVINDSILKVDTINLLRKEGCSVLHAVLAAGVRRLKPILMTSLTTILAIAPFLIRGDMGSDLQYPLSVAVIAGMVTGTLVSVYFVPLIYYAIYRRK